MHRARLAVMMFVAALAAPTISAQGDPIQWGPHPELGPAEVVRLQLEALQHNDEPAPDSGIARAFRFASPGNRSEIGPLPRFAELIHEGYPELLDHREAHLLPIVQHGDEAVQAVELTSRDGSVYRYLFVLSRQTDPPYEDCWMTDSVLGDPQGPRAPREMTI